MNDGPHEHEAHAEHHITKGMDAREQVEQTADRIRDELLLTLEELDRRKDRVLNVRYQATRHRDLLVAVGAAALVLAGVGVGYAVYRARHREELLRRKRRKALERAWSHPERVASTREERPLSAELGRKLVMIFATSLATSVARNSMRTLVPERRDLKAAPEDIQKKE